MHISTRTFILFGIISLVFALGVAYIVGQSLKQDPLLLPPPENNEANVEVTELQGVAVISENVSVGVPQFLTRSFPDTNFSDADSAIEKILSGGPPKDGIPAIDEPIFESVDTFTHSDSVQAIVMEHDDTVKVYPYNILTWHEIVNDTVGETPVSITFCPLCGSAIVFNRTLPSGEETTFGVSGALIESNMVMYDRATESLWQQSTGKGLAGEFVGESLELAPFQLLTMGEVKERYPDALLLSEDTGHPREYARNPYSGYENDNNQFVFGTSKFPDEFEAKEIMVVFRADNTPVATPWLALESKEVEINGEEYILTKTDGELTITDSDGVEIPFYFEMWFSFAIQHGEDAVVI